MVIADEVEDESVVDDPSKELPPVDEDVSLLDEYGTKLVNFTEPSGITSA